MRALCACVLLTSVLLGPSTAWANPNPPLAASFGQRYPRATVHLRAGTQVPSLITHVRAAVPHGEGASGSAAFLREWSGLLGFDPEVSSLALLRVVPTDVATSFRFQQYHLGLRVLNADVVVTVDRDNQIRTISNGLERLGTMDTDFTVSAPLAVEVAVAHLAPQRWGGKPLLVEPVIARVDGEWRTAWLVDLPATVPVGLWRVLVDPQQPEVLSMINQMKTARAYAYDNCPETGAYKEVELTNLESTTMLSGQYLEIYSNCVTLDGYGADCTDNNRQAHPDSDGNYLFTPNEGNPTDPFAEVHTYYGLERMHDFFAGMGFTGLDVKTRVAVNFTLDQRLSCNAGSLGNDAIVVGLCSAISPAVNFAYDAQIVMHEYTHSMVEHAAGLVTLETDDWGAVSMPGALNEGYADFFPAVLLDFPHVGKHVAMAVGMGESMRNLDEVFTCPDNLLGEVHEDGKIWGSANWAAYKASNRDRNLAKAVLESVATLNSKATLQEAANAALASAESYAPSVRAALETAYRAQGLLGCGRELEIPSGKTVTGWLLNPRSLGLQSTVMPFGAQYKINVPEGTGELKLTISAINDDTNASATRRLSVYVNPDTHVVYRASGSQAAHNSNGVSSLSIPNPTPGWYYILPVATSFWSATGYHFSITPQVVAGGPGVDAGVVDASVARDAAVAPDASARPDASVATDAAVMADAATEQDASPVGPGSDGSVNACACDVTGACDSDCGCDEQCGSNDDDDDESCACSTADRGDNAGIMLVAGLLLVGVRIRWMRKR